MTALRVDDTGEYLKALLGISFTEQQMDVIRAGLTPQLVIAGAGSGKTMVMAARVVHAVAHHQVTPSRILGLTFTNKAAGELADRVRRCLEQLRGAGLLAPADRDDDDSAYDDLPTVATYHSYAAQIVRDHALRIGREPGAALLTEAVRWQLAMRVASRASGPFQHLNWSTPYVADLIVALADDMAEHLATPEQIRRHDERVRAAIDQVTKPLSGAQTIYEKTLARDELLGLVATYTAEKQRLDVIDFGDQVALACAIVKASPDVAAIERQRFGVVVLDEYQDTGVAQRILLSRLFGAGHAVTSVGDPNQAIYGWRGASVSNLIRFADHFDAVPATRDYLPLLTSFRCDGRILAAANAVVEPLAISAKRRGRRHLELEPLLARSGAEQAGDVRLARHGTAVEEAIALAEQIRSAIDGGTPPGEIAVLARRRLDFPRLHRAMVERDIPVEVVGLGGLLAMPEVSDIVAVLSLLVDATANTAAVRLLTGPRWRLGVRDLAALGARASYLAQERPLDPATGTELDEDDGAPADGGDLPVSDGLDHVLQQATAAVDPVEVPSLLEAAESPGRASRCSPEALARLGLFAAEVRRLRSLVGQPLVDLIAEVITTTGLDVEIEAGDPALAVARIANVHAFLDVAAGFTGLDGEADLTSFLGYLRAAAENEDGLDIAPVSDANTVKLMTVHAAKGLEWDVVAVPGLVDKVFPSDRGRQAWTTGAQVLPFDCRGDFEDLPVLAGYTNPELKAFRDDCRADADDEERRLAYVAMTRARHQLWLSAYAWSPTRHDPVAISPYLDEVQRLGDRVVTIDAWCEDPAPDAANPLQAEGVADVPWPASPDPAELSRRRSVAALVESARGQLGLEGVLTGSARDTAELWRRDAALLIEEARRRRVRTIDVAVPARLTTSQIVALARDEEAFARTLARPMPSRPQPQARRGSRFHQWVEQLYGAAPLLEPDDLPGAEDDELSDDELSDLQQRFLAGGWGDRRPVKVEAPFEMVLGARLIRGRIDAVYPSGDGGYDVIDYKTGAVPTGTDFEAASLQLSIYRLAWADLADVEPEVVTAGFLYARTGEVKRPERLLSRDELRLVLDGPHPAAAAEHLG